MFKKQMATASSYWSEFIPKSYTFLHRRYSWKLFRKDFLAGITVGVVALPLAMAFAIASGLSPEKGLYTAIVAGFLISLLGGSRLQIGGPTGAFVVIIYEIVQRSGYEGLVSATLLAGLILLIVAFSRLGSLIKYVPYPVVIGFTTGIAVIIFSSQVKDFLGLQMGQVPADFIPKWMALGSALPTLYFPTFFLALGTLGFIICLRRFFPQLPWGILAVVAATLVSWGFQLPVETIATRFGGIPRTLPSPVLPSFPHSFAALSALIPDAITIAFLAGIESLLSAVVADGMVGTRHRSNGELMAQGVANIGSIVFGGIPATGAIARTATNIKSGAQTPVAGMIHALTLLGIMLAFAPIVSQIPLAALSAVLMMVAWNMSELHHFRHLFKAPLGDVVVLLTTFLLTILIDLTVAVEVGMILALFLFMKRMEQTSKIMPLAALEREYAESNEKYAHETMEKKELPKGVEVYEIVGPFFFGVADSLKSTLSHLELPPKVFILRMHKVSFVDASGMHALREFYDKCRREGIILLLSGVNSTLERSLRKFGVVDLLGEQHLFSHVGEALKHAQRVVQSNL